MITSMYDEQHRLGEIYSRNIGRKMRVQILNNSVYVGQTYMKKGADGHEYAMIKLKSGSEVHVKPRYVTAVTILPEFKKGSVEIME